VQRKIGSGLYTSASEVVSEALRALYEKEAERSTPLENLREVVAIGIQSVDSSNLKDWDDILQREVKTLGRTSQR